MPTIDGFKLPKEITDYYKELLEDATAETLLRLAKKSADDFKGIRLQKSSAVSIKSRIKKVYLTGNYELGENLKFHLSVYGIHHRFIKNISRDTLKTFFDEFQIIFDPYVFLGNMLLDNRDEVRELTIECLQNKTYKNKKDELDEASKKALRLYFAGGAFSDLFYDILRESDALIDDDEDEETESKALLESQDEIIDLRKEIGDALKKLKKSQRETTQARKIIKSLESKNSKHEKKAKALKAKLEREKEKAKQAEKALRKQENKNQELINKMAESVAKKVNKEIGTSITTWLESPIEIEKETLKSISDILSKADKALAKQAKADKHTGNRKKLTDRLEILENTRQNISLARTEALNPIDELKEVSKELDREIFRIKKTLGLETIESSVVTKVKAVINEMTLSSGMQKADTLINEVANLGLVTPGELGVLQNYYKNAAWRMYDSRISREGKIDGSSPFEILAYVIKNNKELLLFIDGHNIILSEKNKVFFDFLWEMESEILKRKALAQLTANIFEAASNIEVRLYFDSPSHSIDSMTKNVKVVYSGGGRADQRADDSILSYLEYQNNQKDSRRLMIVTDDKELAEKAQKKKALHVPVRLFGAVLNGLAK